MSSPVILLNSGAFETVGSRFVVDRAVVAGDRAKDKAYLLPRDRDRIPNPRQALEGGRGTYDVRLSAKQS